MLFPPFPHFSLLFLVHLVFIVSLIVFLIFFAWFLFMLYLKSLEVIRLISSFFWMVELFSWNSCLYILCALVWLFLVVCPYFFLYAIVYIIYCAKNAKKGNVFI